MNSLQLKKIGPFWTLHFGSLKCVLPKPLNIDKAITLDIQENEAFLITSDGSIYEVKIKDNEDINLESIHQATVVSKCYAEPIDTKIASVDNTNPGGKSDRYNEETSTARAQDIDCKNSKPDIDFATENETVKPETHKKASDESLENVQFKSNRGDVFQITYEPQEHLDTQLCVDNGLHDKNSGSFEEKTNISTESGKASDTVELKNDTQEALHEQCLPPRIGEIEGSALHIDNSIECNAPEIETSQNESRCVDEQYEPEENSNALQDLETSSSETYSIVDDTYSVNDLHNADSEKASDNVAEMETVLFDIETTSDIYEGRASPTGYEIGESSDMIGSVRHINLNALEKNKRRKSLSDVEKEILYGEIFSQIEETQDCKIDNITTEYAESTNTQSLLLSAKQQSYEHTRDKAVTVSKISPSTDVQNSPYAPTVPPQRSYADAAARPKTTSVFTTQPSSVGQRDVFVCCAGVVPKQRRQIHFSGNATE